MEQEQMVERMLQLAQWIKEAIGVGADCGAAIDELLELGTELSVVLQKRDEPDGD